MTLLRWLNRAFILSGVVLALWLVGVPWWGGVLLALGWGVFCAAVNDGVFETAKVPDADVGADAILAHLTAMLHGVPDARTPQSGGVAAKAAGGASTGPDVRRWEEEPCGCGETTISDCAGRPVGHCGAGRI